MQMPDIVVVFLNTTTPYYSEVTSLIAEVLQSLVLVGRVWHCLHCGSAMLLELLLVRLGAPYSELLGFAAESASSLARLVCSLLPAMLCAQVMQPGPPVPA